MSLGEQERLADAVAGAGYIESLTAWRRVGEGWNCDTYLVNDEWIVQFPIGQNVRDKLRREVGFLARLKPFLSTPTPTVRLLSEEPFCVAYPVLVGEQALFNADVLPTGLWPEQLGATLAELHRVPAAAVGWNQEGPEIWQRTCQRWFERLLERVYPLLLEAESDALSTQVQEFLATLSVDFRPSVIHRDVGPEHLLISHTGDLVGIIDWAEAMVGDPAIDFSWMIDRWPAEAERALSRYEPIDDRFRTRAKMYANIGPWYEVARGLETSDDVLIERALDSVRTRIRSF